MLVLLNTLRNTNITSTLEVSIQHIQQKRNKKQAFAVTSTAAFLQTVLKTSKNNKIIKKGKVML